MIKNIYKLEELTDAKPWEGKTVTLVGGCFDLLHYGHVLFLENARKEADVLVIALESDEFVKQKKKRQSVHTQEQRAHILSVLSCVDYIVLLPLLNTDADYQRLVQTIKPTVIAVTEKDPYLQVKQEHADSVGATVKVTAPLVEPFSSSHILTYENLLGH